MEETMGAVNKVYTLFCGGDSYYKRSDIVVSKRNELMAAGKTINQFTKDGDTIISLGFPCQIYLFTERRLASRYIYQTSGAGYDPNMRQEFFADIQAGKPKIIAIPNENDRYDYLPDWYSPIYAMIINDYRLLSAENGYYLFVRKEI